MDEFSQAYKNYIESEEYRNIGRDRLLSDGKSAEVFFTDVRARVNLEFMGIADTDGSMNAYAINGNKITTLKKGGKLQDLIVPNGTLSASTRLYAEYGTSKPLITNKENVPYFESFDFDSFLAKLLIIQSWAGRVLVRGVLTEESCSMYAITPRDYFRIFNEYNPKQVDAYVVYQLIKAKKENEQDLLLTEIYKKDVIEYKAYRKSENGTLIEIQHPQELDLQEDGLGYYLPTKGFGVFEVQNIFGKSDYTEDLIGLIRELVVGDTLTSQAFQKVANPLLQVPSSLVEYTNGDQAQVRLDDRVITLRPEDHEVKQVALETKTVEWKEHKTDIVNEAYKMLAVNDLAFGVNVEGAIASGEAKKRSLERTLATVESKRSNCIAGMLEVANWCLGMKEQAGEKLEITAQEILSISTVERVSIACMAVAQGIMSVETAIEYIGIVQDDTEGEAKKVKLGILSQEKMVNMLNVLAGIQHEEDMAKAVDDMSAKLIAELGL